ncbi:uncharacterized protein HMPREF1541_06880 [Cyphellophora europaea CBS 101466]|uniref:DNA mismatch repair proteins mutS family domain-containing protein n=1 Tax=Cyphellophora europaea (strain CBS 101466) TaxID=1220924 RepID=W2RR99_CYPE1|nr:uncharacterized protein HMPREF1541_06880 [Cyphellophora europaea CBS 101466]ETN38840.1 hypothetical protein HMPREF1541_06880 [Cyphellophora europaea CBS 101466]
MPQKAPAPSTSTEASNSHKSGMRPRTTTSRPRTGRSRPRTAATSTGYGENDIVCAISESRGLSPTIGLSFVNLTTSEAVLCQFTDTQTYARTCHKIHVFNPSDILYMSAATESNLVAIIAENLKVEENGMLLTEMNRKYWVEGSGHEYIQRLAFPDDLESLKVSAGGNFFATCCFAAAMNYAELAMNVTFAPQTLRIRFESSEGSMMIDLSTISSLELIQNLQDAKSRDSLFGLMNQTLTKMGARMLRSSILQPSTDARKIVERYDAIGELVSREEMFFAVREALAGFVDTDRCLSALVRLPTQVNFEYMEQSANNVLMLKTFVESIRSVWQALIGAASIELKKILEELIKYAINDDVAYAHQATELRNQRVYAIRVGVNGFLDVARTTYKEINQDVVDMTAELSEGHNLGLDVKFDTARQFYLRVPASEFDDRAMPDVFVNVVRRKQYMECQTLDLMKMNQKIKDAHSEVISMSDKSIQELIDNIRTRIHSLFKISEAIALLDMLAAFAHLTSVYDYVKPEVTGALAIKAGRHPIREKIQSATHKLIPNDVYATEQNRFQIITGCNMSGKSTYIRSIALMAVMLQAGCYAPASYASFPIFHQLFARVSTDSAVEANVSTFAAEMRDTAHILRNIEPRSLVIIDELGRGTSTTDGLAIAIAIAEALIESKAFVWFVTHFRDLPRILAERAGVVNLHLSVNFSVDENDPAKTKMKMTYKISDGPIPAENQFYGLALAKTIQLPQRVVEVATQVSEALNNRNQERKSSTKALAVARKRRLVLSLREQLLQARESAMKGEELRRWLKALQDEFVVRLQAIEWEAEDSDMPRGDPELASQVSPRARYSASSAPLEQTAAAASGLDATRENMEDLKSEVFETESVSDATANAQLHQDMRNVVRVKHERLEERQHDMARQRPREPIPWGGSGDTGSDAIVIDSDDGGA